jgi:hypothetical protein
LLLRGAKGGMTMADREKVIKEYDDYVNSYISLTTSDDYEFEMHKAVLSLLKEQEAEIKEKNQRIWELLCERDSDDGK